MICSHVVISTVISVVSEDRPVASRARSLWGILMQTARSLDNRCAKVAKEEGFWVRNCGKSVSHVLGPAMLLAKLGIIKRMKGNTSRKAIRVGLGNMKYCLLTHQREKARALKILQRCVQASPIFETIYKNPPRTLQQWRQRCTEASEAVNKLDAPPYMKNTTSYVWKWLLRTTLIAAMRQGKVSSLRLDSTASVTTFCGCFPDSSQWVKRLAQRFHVTNMQRLLSKLKYKDSVEFLSMHLCFLGNASLDSFSMAKVGKAIKLLAQRQAAYRRKACMWPIVAVLLEDARRDKRL